MNVYSFKRKALKLLDFLQKSCMIENYRFLSENLVNFDNIATLRLKNLTEFVAEKMWFYSYKYFRRKSIHKKINNHSNVTLE